MNSHRSVSLALAAIHWTIAVALGVAGSQSDDVRLLFWAVLSALVAGLLTNHVMMETLIREERIRVEHLVDGLIAAAQATVKAEIRNLR